MANGSASGETYRNDLASDKERPLAEATTNTTTIIARADQHDIDLHKASDRVNFGSIREPIDVPYLLGVQTDSFDWLIGNERWQKRVEEDLANGTNTVPHTSGLDEAFQEISPAGAPEEAAHLLAPLLETKFYQRGEPFRVLRVPFRRERGKGKHG